MVGVTLILQMMKHESLGTLMTVTRLGVGKAGI